ncbi:MAG: DUF6636 domain-containing protein [Candidatus Nanopelagicales bacterium]
MREAGNGVRWGKAVTAALLLSACTVGTGQGAQTRTSESAGPTPSPSPGRSTTSADTAAPSQGPVDDRSGQDAVEFVMPSGNITCELSNWGKSPKGAAAVCMIDEWTWTPPYPVECSVDWINNVFWLSGSHVGLGECSGDPPISPYPPSDPPETLAYGTAIRLDSIICTSQSDAVHCLDGRTGAGFILSRVQYTIVGAH